MCDCPKPEPRRSRRREAVLKAVASVSGHRTAEEIRRLAEGSLPGIGIATVYRSLKCLCGCGKVVEFKRGKKPSVYELAGARTGHAHLLCRKCGSVTEVPLRGPEKILRRLSAGTGFFPTGSRVEIYGTCKGCLKEDTL